MVSKTETTESKGDSLKLAFAVLLLIGAIGAYHFYDDQSLLLRVLGLLVVVGVTVAIAYHTLLGRRAWSFVQDSRTEMRKVVWPTRAETVQTALIVMLVVVVVGIFLWLLDMVLAWGFQALTGTGA